MGDALLLALALLQDPPCRGEAAAHVADAAKRGEAFDLSGAADAYAAAPAAEAGHAPVMTYRYRPEVLEQLLGHGVRPTPDTRPELVFEFVNDLYRYELRRLRHALVTGGIPKVGYYDRVVDLRRKYPLVSIKPHLWIDPAC